MWYEFNFVPERNIFWKYVKSTLETDNYIFEGRGDWGKSHFFSLGSKSHFLFLGVHGAGGGGVKPVITTKIMATCSLPIFKNALFFHKSELNTFQLLDLKNKTLVFPIETLHTSALN